MNKTLPPLLAALALASALAWGPAHADTPSTTVDRVLALVNSEPITANDLRFRLQRQAGTAAAQNTPPEVFAEQALDRLISEQALLAHARMLGIQVDDAAVDQQLANIAQQNQFTPDQLAQQLQGMGMSVGRFKQSLRNDLMLQQLREQVVSGLRISDLEVDRYLDEQNRTSDPASTVLQLAQLLVPLPDSPSPEALTQAQQRIAALKTELKTTPFDALVTKYATGSAGVSGSQLGTRTADRLPPLFVTATKTARAGDVVGPVRSGAGLHLLQVVQKRNLNLPEPSYTETQTRHILLRTEGITQAQAIDKLNAWRDDILAGKTSFAAVARAHSQDGSAPNGGDLGWAAPGQFVPEFEQAMARLEPNQISPPVVSRFGVHLIEVVARRTQALTPEQYREQIRNLVREQKGAEAFEQLVQDVRAQAFVERREAL